MVENDEDDITQPYVGKRKILRVGGSLCIVLPKNFIKDNNLEEGSEIGMVANRDLLLTKDDDVINKLNEDLHAHAHKKIRECINKGK